MTPIRPGTARRLGLDKPEPPRPPRFSTWAEAFAAMQREIAEAFGPTDEQKAAMFRRALGADK